MYFFYVRPPDTIDTLLFFAASAASQAFCGTESKKKRQISVEICRFFLPCNDTLDTMTRLQQGGSQGGADWFRGFKTPISAEYRRFFEFLRRSDRCRMRG